MSKGDYRPKLAQGVEENEDAMQVPDRDFRAKPVLPGGDESAAESSEKAAGPARPKGSFRPVVTAKLPDHPSTGDHLPPAA